MSGRTLETDPRLGARLAGVFFLLEGATAVFGQLIVPGRLIVPGDAAGTAANILQHESLYRLAFASALTAAAFHVAWALLFYWLLKPVNQKISLLATFVMLVGCTLQAAAAILLIAPLLVLESGSSLSAFSPDQIEALAFVFLKLNAQTFNGHLIFFGFWCLLVGYLIAKSTFLPRIIGLLMILAGLGYVTYLSAPLGKALAPYNLISAAPGELSLLVWLLVKGVNVRRWQESAGVLQTGGA